MARPERFELPTFWFAAGSSRRNHAKLPAAGAMPASLCPNRTKVAANTRAALPEGFRSTHKSTASPYRNIAVDIRTDVNNWITSDSTPPDAVCRRLR